MFHSFPDWLVTDERAFHIFLSIYTFPKQFPVTASEMLLWNNPFGGSGKLGSVE